MPKIRGFKADLWTDEDFVELSPYARLLWMGMWNYCCDNGHIADKSKQIKMRVLPTDDVNCAELLRELEQNNRIVRENDVITIPNFTKHQKPDKRYFQTCDVPGCTKPDESSQRETRGGNASEPRGSQGPHDEVNRSEVNRSDGEGSTAGKPAASKGKQLPDDFEPNDTNRRIAAERGLDLAAVMEQWADHHRARGSVMKDWHAALNTWLRRERPGNNVTPIRGGEAITGHFQPFTMPPAPADVEGDPEKYAAWAEGRRQAWQAGERW